MINSNFYLEKLKEILDLQLEILDIVKKGEIVTKEYFENRQNLLAKLSVLDYDKNDYKIVELKQKVINIEKEILKEADKMLNLSKLKILQHEKSTQNMVNYFKSQIQSQSEIDFKA